MGTDHLRKQSLTCFAFLCSLAAIATAHAAESAVVPTGDVASPRQPHAAVSGDGSVYVAFGAGDAVYCSASTNGGESFRDAVQVGKVERLALGMRRGPRIAAGADGTAVVTAVSHATGEVLAWRSADRGRTWTGPVRVNDNSPATANEGLHALAAAPNGDLYCVWLDHRIEKKNQVFGAASTDGGKTWSDNRLIYRSPSGRVCPCCHPAVTFDSEGTLYVMWRNSLDGFRDMYAAVSRDGGETFSPATKLGEGAWKLDACPMDGGYLAAGKPGQLTTVWRREKQIYRTDSGRGGEQLLGFGEQPWIAATSNGAWIVWLSKRGGSLWLSAPHAEQAVKLDDDATDPVISASPAGEGPVIAAWESGHGSETRIMARRLGP
ncbi:MAG: glycoside hydrolase [Planctomycetes bacterium]|nr:glycoside hydrolase [Planctomycetota bacterium]